MIQKIKALPSVAEKVQAIALNGYLIEKRRLDKEMQNETSKIETEFREKYMPQVKEVNMCINIDSKHY